MSELRRLGRIDVTVANVSHELKTPLTSIEAVETLLDGAIDDDEYNVRFLEKIENNVERLNHLVMDLLSLARIESQAGMLSRQSIDLHSILEEAMRRYEATAEARQQTLVLDACSGSVRILGDQEALTQILDNLFDNALKYTPDEGTVTVRVFRGGTHVTLEVEDNGVGIPEEDQARIFERFYRVDKALARRRRNGPRALDRQAPRACDPGDDRLEAARRQHVPCARAGRADGHERALINQVVA